jgi:hypothetical protein
MRNKLTQLFLFVALLLGNMPPMLAQDPNAGWQFYFNRQFGMHVKLPIDWKVSYPRGTMTSFMIGKPRKSDEPQQMVQFVLQKDQNPKQLPIEEWATRQLGKMREKSQAIRTEKIGGRPAICLEHDTSLSHTFDFYLRGFDGDILTISIMQPPSEKKLKPVYEQILQHIRL